MPREWPQIQVAFSSVCLVLFAHRPNVFHASMHYAAVSNLIPLLEIGSDSENSSFAARDIDLDTSFGQGDEVVKPTVSVD